jgi:hypothetical protein
MGLDEAEQLGIRHNFIGDDNYPIHSVPLSSTGSPGQTCGSWPVLPLEGILI